MALVVKEFARHLAEPMIVDRSRVRRLLRYLRGMLGYTFKLTGHLVDDAKDDLNAFAYANWATSVLRRSTSGGAIYY
eukprot:6863323-Heterocapsa_arctica.AAC.1